MQKPEEYVGRSICVGPSDWPRLGKGLTVVSSVTGLFAHSQPTCAIQRGKDEVQGVPS